MADMTAQEMAAFLNEPHVADLVTLRERGSPHIAPVWYWYKDERVLIIADETAVKVRNIQRDPRIAVSIATDGEPYQYVLFEGIATVTRQEVEQTTLAICVRYRGQERGVRYANELLGGSSTVVIEVSPHRAMTWRDDGSPG